MDESVECSAKKERFIDSHRSNHWRRLELALRTQRPQSKEASRTSPLQLTFVLIYLQLSTDKQTVLFGECCNLGIIERVSYDIFPLYRQRYVDV